MTGYRRLGADLPFGDPVRDHGSAMEGYYWRFTDAAAGRVVIALCGVCSAPDGRWALVAVAAHPEGVVRSAVVPVASADSDRLGVAAGSVLSASPGSLAVTLDDLALDVRFEGVGWPRRAFGGLGAAQIVPGLPQYWHPFVLGGRARGTLSVPGTSRVVEGSVYCEKNWGPRFHSPWWWGQAQGFSSDPSLCVAFAGGPIRLAGVPLAPTAVVVRTADRLLRLGAPFARTVAEVGSDAWRVRARSARFSVEIEGSTGGAPATLPVPIVAERRTYPGSHQVLAGRMAVVVRRGRRVLLRDESDLAGLERAVDLGA